MFKLPDDVGTTDQMANFHSVRIREARLAHKFRFVEDLMKLEMVNNFIFNVIVLIMDNIHDNC